MGDPRLRASGASARLAARSAVGRAAAASALLILLCAVQAAAWAQRAAAPESPRRYVAIGCVGRQGQPARYLLTDRRDPPQVYRLQGDASQLDLHVGHLVEVAGTLSPAPSGGRGPNANAPILKIASLIWISNTCPKS